MQVFRARVQSPVDKICTAGRHTGSGFNTVQHPRRGCGSVRNLSQGGTMPRRAELNKQSDVPYNRFFVKVNY